MILNGNAITKTYSRCGTNFNAVDNAEIFAWSGDFIVIFGESGSGKSTLLSALAGTGKPTSGSVELDGENLFEMDDEKLSSLRNKRIGYIPQNIACLPHFTVRENIQLVADLYGKDADPAWIDELLEILSLRHLADEYPADLSGGELRRVAMVRALVNHPDLIVADEPTSNLDEDNSRKAFSLLSGFAKKGSAIVVATHDKSAMKYGDRIYHMKAGILSAVTSEYGNL